MSNMSNMSNEELKTIEEIKQLANIIDVSAKELQTGLRNFLIAKESGCSWFWIPKMATLTDDISFLRRKLMELSKMLHERKEKTNMNNFEKNETQCLYGERRTPSDKVVVEECPECGSEVWLKWDEKTGEWTEWTRETGGKMNVSWIKAETKPPKDGDYYTISEMQKDGIFYKKGDIVIEFDWYSEGLGWEISRGSLSEWKVLAWAEIPLPYVPEEVKDRLVKYFDVKVKNRRNK